MKLKGHVIRGLKASIKSLEQERTELNAHILEQIGKGSVLELQRKVNLVIIKIENQRIKIRNIKNGEPMLGYSDSDVTMPLRMPNTPRII